MYLVKVCRVCGKKIRFPLDRGTIRVSCDCGYSFLADPDDRALYIDATIDLTPGPTEPRPSLREITGILIQRIKSVKEKFSSPRIDLGHTKQIFIRRIYDAKYWIQNYHLHPDSEKKKILIPLCVLLFLAACLMLSRLL